jgi:hypothetical protein
MDLQVPSEITNLCEAFLQGLKTALGESLYGVYLYGAIAFQDQCPLGDIDFHVIIKSSLNNDEKAALTHMHKVLAHNFPPLGAELDGYYILLDEARQTSPPRHQFQDHIRDESWALHRQHILAGRCIILYGPDPHEVYPPATWLELEQALWEEFLYIVPHLIEYPAYCVLNLCRLMYSYSTQEVVISKRASANWAETVFPEWIDLIDAARHFYNQQITAQDQVLLKDNSGLFLAFAQGQIMKSRYWPKGLDRSLME